jgi:GNAT superfamily N-acetyltransferase
MLARHDDPAEPAARRDRVRAPFDLSLGVDPADPPLHATLRGWDWVARSLLARDAVSPQTRVRLEDSRRIVGELLAVVSGEEPGEGVPWRRQLVTASAGGRVQAVAALFPCPRSIFVELVATAPWNLLAAGDPADARAVRGAGGALLEHAERWSRGSGRGGRVSLQAENPRALALYERLGFAPMRPSDAPLALVPPGADGYSPSVLRLARGCPAPQDLSAPWMLLDPARRGARPPAPPRVHRVTVGHVPRALPPPA